jgi:hypothetical protein
LWSWLRDPQGVVKIPHVQVEIYGYCAQRHRSVSRGVQLGIAKS